MEENIILDYEQVDDKLQELIDYSKNSQIKINEEENLGITDCGLPIKHYTIGNGKKHIVFTGAVHGCEIISTDFLVHLMEDIVQGNEKFKFLSNGEYTLDFIPILNPEGYLITTTAIRKLIPRDMPAKEAEKLCKEYWSAYRKDDQNALQRKKDGLEPDHETLKLHQEMFKDVTWNDIPDKYIQIKEKLKELYEKYDIPEGSMITWSANADGIDLNANSKYNKNILDIERGKDIFNTLRYSNIKLSEPGPVNCPYDSEKGFEVTEENKSIESFLDKLHKENNLLAYFNYHGTGGLLYQRPAEMPSDIDRNDIDLDQKSLRNYLLSKFYQEETYKNVQQKDSTQYRILTGKSNASSSNDVFRILYPADILVELSGMGGNPIAPYGDLEGNYRDLINSNISAVSNAIEVIDLSNKVADASNNIIKKLEEGSKMQEDKMLDKYSVLDMIYSEFARKLESLRNNPVQKIENDGEEIER